MLQITLRTKEANAGNAAVMERKWKLEEKIQLAPYKHNVHNYIQFALQMCSYYFLISINKMMPKFDSLFLHFMNTYKSIWQLGKHRQLI